MYIDVVPNRNSRPAILLRESLRQGQRTIKKTLANMTDWPPVLVATIRLTLKGVALVPKSDVFAIERSLPHGHVQAVLGTLRQIGLETLLASKRCRERDLVVAMIVQRLIDPCSKLATTREWHETTLAQEVEVEDASENDLYAALDWLVQRQARIERKLARRHLSEGAVVLYDLTSSTYFGRTCSLAAYGHNRDGTKQRCIAYGVLADREGRPVAVDVYAGNTGDPTTVPDQVEKLRARFGLARVVLVGDRGMLTNTQIATLHTHEGVGWISALRSEAIRGLVESGELQLSLFDKQHLAEITSPDFPGERLIACYNPLLAAERTRTRQELLAATEQRLAKIAAEVRRRTHTPLTAGGIGVKVGRVLTRYKVAKHFSLTIADHRFEFQRDEASITREECLDGMYVLRTSEGRAAFSNDEVVRTYKSLSQVEQAFRCLKGVDLRVRPIYHRIPDHVRAHVFLCTLAYYVEWHMRRALAPVLFADEDLPQTRARRDPVAKAEPSEAVKRKKASGVTPDGWPVQSFQSLLTMLGTRCRNTCRAGTGKAYAIFYTMTEPTPMQTYVFKLLGLQA